MNDQQRSKNRVYAETAIVLYVTIPLSDYSKNASQTICRLRRHRDR